MFRESSAGAPQMGSFLPFARLRCTGSHILVQGSKVDAVPILDLKGKDCASRQFSPDFKQSPVANEMSIKIRGCFPSHKVGHSHVGPAASKLREWFAVQQATRPQWHSMHLNAISGGLEHGFYFPYGSSFPLTNSYFSCRDDPLGSNTSAVYPFPRLILPRLGTVDTTSLTKCAGAKSDADHYSLNQIESYWIIQQPRISFPLKLCPALAQENSRRVHNDFTCGGDIFYSCESPNSSAQSGMFGWPRCDFHPSARKPWAVLKKRGYHNCYSNS